MKTKHHGQMSESFLTAVFLSLSGGLQDAYTYLFRGKVFANAQTGTTMVAGYHFKEYFKYNLLLELSVWLAVVAFMPLFWNLRV